MILFTAKIYYIREFYFICERVKLGVSKGISLFSHIPKEFKVPCGLVSEVRKARC